MENQVEKLSQLDDTLDMNTDPVTKPVADGGVKRKRSNSIGHQAQYQSSSGVQVHMETSKSSYDTIQQPVTGAQVHTETSTSSCETIQQPLTGAQVHTQISTLSHDAILQLVNSALDDKKVLGSFCSGESNQILKALTGAKADQQVSSSSSDQRSTSSDAISVKDRVMGIFESISEIVDEYCNYKDYTDKDLDCDDLRFICSYKSTRIHIGTLVALYSDIHLKQQSVLSYDAWKESLQSCAEYINKWIPYFGVGWGHEDITASELYEFCWSLEPSDYEYLMEQIIMIENATLNAQAYLKWLS